MNRTIWTKLQSDPNGSWTRHEGTPPFNIPATGDATYDVRTDTGESFVITPQAAAYAPVLSGSPVVFGTYEVGQTLTAAAAPSNGTEPILTSWQWLRDGANISGATDAAYTLIGADEGTQISVRQTDSNGVGSDSATSTATQVQPSVSNNAVISELVVSDQTFAGEVALTYAISANSAVTGVLTTSATTPTAAQILAGQDHTGAAAPDTFTDTWTTAGSDSLPDIAEGLASNTYYMHVLPNGGGDGDIASSNGFTLETVAPTVSSAATNSTGDKITLTMTETVAGTGNPTSWSISGVSSGSPTIDSVDVSGTTITLTISGNIVSNGDTVTVGYTPGEIVDAVSNPLAAFTGQPITNNVPGYADTLVTVGSDAYLTAPAGAPADTRSLMFFFSGVQNPGLGRTMLASWDGTSEGFWTKYTGGTTSGIRARVADNAAGNVAVESSLVNDGDRYHVLVTAWCDDVNLTLKSSIWSAASGWVEAITATTDASGVDAVMTDLIANATRLFRSTSGASQFEGQCARISLWTSTAKSEIADSSSSAVQDNFTNGGLTIDPTTSQTAYGQALFDFYGSASLYNSGTHAGSLGSFVPNGVFI